MKVLTVLGARPQFVKAAAVSRAFKAGSDVKEIIIHTGQHFDVNMSEVFFDQLDIPKPNYNLGIGSLNHGAMTGRMLEKIETLINLENPNWVLVYGDTNSTLAGALAAAKMHVPVAHVEAGLRSYNFSMPEEINRILTDRVSSLLLCPTNTAEKNLVKEGFPFSLNDDFIQRIENVGDVMLDASLYYKERAKERISLETFGVTEKSYVICTLHRAENTDSRERLTSIFSALRKIAKELPVLLPLHPRTKAKLELQNSADMLRGITILEPVPYLEMQRLQLGAKLILTDSGGIQKEAYFHRVPCITLRDETEWVETLSEGWNTLAGADSDLILKKYEEIGTTRVISDSSKFGFGDTASRIVSLLSC